MKNAEPKLLIVVNVDWFFCSHRLPVALGALRNGYEVHIATTFTNPRLRTMLVSHGFALHDLAIDRSGRSLFSLVATFVRIYKLCSLLRPDVVHLVTIQPVLIGGIAARAAGTKNFVFAISGLGHAFVANSFLSRLRRSLVKVLYRFALDVKRRVVVFQNSGDQSSLSKICGLGSSESCLLPGSGVDLSVFTSKPFSNERPIVLMASRLLVTKGVRDFIDAASILSSRKVSVKFQLAGGPDLSNPAAISLDELEKWRDQGVIELLGIRNDLHELMSHAHIICLPSYYPEGLPKVLCEAAACGRAVVTTDEPGCRDAILHGITGLLVPSRDPHALADALEYLISNPDLVHSMGSAGRRRAEELFDINAIVASHLDIYSRLLTHG